MEKLGPPPAYILPEKGFTHPPHPLLDLAATTSKLAQKKQSDGEFDIEAALSANNVYVVAQRDEAYEYFVGKFISPDLLNQSSDSAWFKDSLLRGNPLYLNVPSVKTFDGRELRVRHKGLIFPQFTHEDDQTIPEDSSSVIAHFINPDTLKQNPKQPQIFTLSTAFNPVHESWSGYKSGDNLLRLPQKDVVRYANTLVKGGLNVMANESQDPYVRQSSKRLIELRANNSIFINITPDPEYTLATELKIPEAIIPSLLPSQYSIPYIPNMNQSPSTIRGSLVIPYDWIVATGEKPVVALAHLLHTASIVRDDFNGRLKGTHSILTPFGIYDVSNTEQARIRAGSMTAALLNEAISYDHKVYAVNLNLDPFCLKLRSQYPFGTNNALHYNDDPPRGSSHTSRYNSP